MDNQTILGLLNPIRMKIITTLLELKEATRKEIQEQTPSIPQATLYRHLKALLNEGVLKVSKETRIRGTIEATYRLSYNPFQKLQELGNNNDAEQLSDLFFTFALSLIMDFNSYLNREDIDLKRDSVGFRTIPMHMKKEDVSEFFSELRSLISRYTEIGEDENGEIRKFSFVFTPHVTQEEETE